MFKLIFCFSLTIVLFSCSTVTTFNEQWSDKDYEDKKIQNVLVMLMDGSEQQKEEVELMIAQNLKDAGIKADAGHKYIPTDTNRFRLDSAKIRSKMIELGFDAILTIDLRNYDKQENYVPPTTNVYGGYRAGYGYWGPVYRYGVSVEYNPGYYYSTVTVILESRLYKVKDSSDAGNLIWMGNSTTNDPTSLIDQVNSYSKALISALKASGYIPKI
jgi:hypothetical protein